MELGKKQVLQIVKMADQGAYLAESADSEERVLLPKKQVKEDAKIGDKIEVFLYKDSMDRPISTINEPKIRIGQVAKLKVVEVAKMGAFLDWGLEKDLFLPYREQTKKVKAGETYLFALYVDKSERLAATMNVYEALSQDSPYGKDDHVKGTIYEISRNFGVFVAVDDKYSGLIPAKENFGQYEIGQEVEARVTGVREDGKLNLSAREKAYLQMDKDALAVLEKMEKCGGALPFTDKADPEVIKAEMNLSKNAFKRAVGRLLKEGKVEIKATSIRLKNKRVCTIKNNR